VPDGDEELAVPMRPGAGSIIDARGVPASREVLERGGSLDEAEAADRGQDRTRQPL
jgi:PiT family inorganic phosphate transporter